MVKTGNNAHILTVNAGSSSIKLGIFMLLDPAQKVLEASVQNIGLSITSMTTPEGTRPVTASSHTEATKLLAEWLTAQGITINAVGHRIVHGGPRYNKTQLATDETLAGLGALTAIDPEHLPIELELVQTFKYVFPAAHHTLCFDTTFHHNLPMHSQLLPIPRRFYAEGVRRYGFHGLSYAHILEELQRVEGDVAMRGKVIIAHLGSGASVAAVQNGEPIDTTMSMTPASGLPMSTRSGDLDPSLALYLAKTHNYDAARFAHMAHFESGLLGISETTADMKQLLETEATDPRAKDAVDIFCYQVKKSIGSFAAALGGLTTLVFTGGMGENAPKIRARICDGLGFLGITLNTQRNNSGARLISADGAAVGVHVIHTDEAITIARETAQLINKL